MYSYVLSFLHLAIAEYSKWNLFSECSVPCGGGTQSRNRTCVSGSCDPLDMVEVEDCNMQCCPGKACHVCKLVYFLLAVSL